MAKIDVSKIEGYKDMTAEQKVAALEAMSLPEPDLSGYVKKDVFDKTASELAQSKKRLTDAMSEEDKKKQESADLIAKLQETVATLTKEKQISEYKAQFLAQGYSDTLALDTATGLAGGDTAKVFANQLVFQEEFKKKILADAMQSNSTPPAGGNPGATDLDYNKRIEEAMNRGDMVTVAALTREQYDKASRPN